MAKIFLKPGDILLYRPAGIFGRLISLKTWHSISHVEIYDGTYKSWASRDGKGFAKYPMRLSELAYVLRPQVDLDLASGRKWAETQIGTPYGWFDLLNFFGLPIDRRGIVCSPAATGYLRACGWNIFPADSINRIAPFQFLDLVGRDCQIAYSPDVLSVSLPLTT